MRALFHCCAQICGRERNQHWSLQGPGASRDRVNNRGPGASVGSDPIIRGAMAEIAYSEALAPPIGHHHLIIYYAARAMIFNLNSSKNIMSV